jgi:hypothetical protein
MAEEKVFRVFVTRHFIAVEWFDVRAATPAKARRKAEKAAKRLPDPRATATDNGWHADPPVEVVAPGSYKGGKRHAMREVDDGVFRPEEP